MKNGQMSFVIPTVSIDLLRSADKYRLKNINFRKKQERFCQNMALFSSGNTLEIWYNK